MRLGNDEYSTASHSREVEELFFNDSQLTKGGSGNHSIAYCATAIDCSSEGSDTDDGLLCKAAVGEYVIGWGEALSAVAAKVMGRRRAYSFASESARAGVAQQSVDQKASKLAMGTVAEERQGASPAMLHPCNSPHLGAPPAKPPRTWAPPG